jgi:hypothetical protein
LTNWLVIQAQQYFVWQFREAGKAGASEQGMEFSEKLSYLNE